MFSLFDNFYHISLTIKGIDVTKWKGDILAVGVIKKDMIKDEKIIFFTMLSLYTLLYCVFFFFFFFGYEQSTISISIITYHHFNNIMNGRDNIILLQLCAIILWMFSLSLSLSPFYCNFGLVCYNLCLTLIGLIELN